MNFRHGTRQEMKTYSLLVALLLSASSLGSEPMPSWGAGWSANVWNTYCELRRTYHIPYPADSQRRGFLAGSMFNSAFVRFAKTTRTHGSVITKDELDKLQFSLYVYPEGHSLPAEQKILSANLGGFEAEARVVSAADIHIFSLPEHESSRLLQRFLAHEVVEFVLRFANGKEATFAIHPSGDRNFRVWEAMFQTCVRENRN